MNEGSIETHFVEHLIDAARLKTEVDNLKSSVSDIQTQTVSALAGLAVKMDALTSALNVVPERIAACRTDVRREVERDFPTRPDAIEMEHRIEKKVEEGDKALAHQISELSTKFVNLEGKVDRMWLKISVAVSVIGTVLVLLGWLLDRLPGVLAVTRSIPH